MNEALGLIAVQLWNRGYQARFAYHGDENVWMCELAAWRGPARFIAGHGPSPLLALERARAELDKEAT